VSRVRSPHHRALKLDRSVAAGGARSPQIRRQTPGQRVHERPDATDGSSTALWTDCTTTIFSQALEEHQTAEVDRGRGSAIVPRPPPAVNSRWETNVACTNSTSRRVRAPSDEAMEGVPRASAPIRGRALVLPLSESGARLYFRTAYEIFAS
jgi:hypothetical protein